MLGVNPSTSSLGALFTTMYHWLRAIVTRVFLIDEAPVDSRLLNEVQARVRVMMLRGELAAQL
jgi:hypothetical protein